MTDTQVGRRLECKRCQHAWNARTEHLPVQCPKCKSPAWGRKPAPSVVAEPRAKYRAMEPKKHVQKKTDEPFDFMSLKSFGMWADLTETDEELLARLREGREFREDVDALIPPGRWHPHPGPSA
jgi:hypothetical protein